MKKFVYSFLEANNVHCSLIGSKAESLAKINSMGLPVPPGFIITTEACKDYYENDQKISKEIKHQILDAILNLEKLTKKKFYRPKDKCYVQPLILSARSGAEVSMPGMMDTILNIGFTNEVIDYLIDETDEPKFVNDTYLRFLRMFLDVNAEILKNKIDSITGSFQDIVFKMKKLYEEKKGCPFPEDTHEQLFCAIDGVFRSWNNKRAKYYRQVNNIPEDGGTAVTVQMMVFGNFQENSGTGVAFSRNPISGEKHLFGEYLTNAQGEDVVAGTRTPSSIDYLKKKMPDVYNEFSNVSQNLEDYFIDIQDMEFTVEKGKLYLLQTRRAKRSPIAAIRTALDFLNRGKINIYQAINRVKPEQIQMLLHPHFDKLSLDNATVIAKGLPAAPGASVGKVIFSSKDAKLWKEKGENVILVRYETSAEDIEGMHIAEGILTSCGGMTSHAAVVARGMGKCCVSGCEEIKIGKNYFISRETKINEGDFISLDGSSGNVYVGKIKTVNEGFSEEIIQFLNLSDKCRKILVMANADSPEDVAQAISMGASGVGLCRTEHMFFANDRINLMREMILAPNSKGRRHALERLFEFQKQDFQKMFDVASGRPIVVRLLDPPLNEFLTDSKEDIEKISYDLNIETLVIQETFQKLKECNPMMGHRGCRLLISYPEIVKMQTSAIILAALESSRKTNVVPEIMVPLVCDVEEIKFLKKIISETADELIKNFKSELTYKIGTMIEVPRAALVAEKIAKEVDFFSFGTNDLTQMTLGLSRDDAQKFLKKYYSNNIYKFDPFVNIDIDGVGELMKTAIKFGKNSNPNLKIGICGEHAGDPKSINFFKNLDIDYISCSPFRVPVARLSAAQNIL